MVRNKTVDILRGIGILAVVAGHAGTNLGIKVFQVYSFHMPLFFFVSGFFFKENHTEPIFCIIKRIFIKILFPALFFVAFYDILVASLLHKSGYIPFIGDASFPTMASMFFYGWQFTSAYWFLSCYLFVYIYFNVIHCRLIKKLHLAYLKNLKFSQIQLFFLIIYFLLSCISLCVSMAVYAGKTGLDMWNVALSHQFLMITIRFIFALFFYYLGFIFSNFKIMDYIQGKSAFILLLLVYCLQAVLFKKFDIIFSMQIMNFNNVFTPILTSILGILFFFTISKIIEKTKVSNYICVLGKKSYQILLHHIFGFTVLNICFVFIGLLNAEDITGIYYKIDSGNIKYAYLSYGILFSLFVSTVWNKVITNMQRMIDFLKLQSTVYIPYKSAEIKKILDKEE